MFCVYMHISPDGKKYIGITSRKPNKRWENGKGYKYNKHFYSAIQKYGWENFKHEILFSGLTKEEAEEKEIKLIDLYKTTDPTKGYNLRLGGSVCTFSEEAIEKMRRSHIGKTIPEEQRKKQSLTMKGRKVSSGMLGRKHTEKTKILLSNLQKGKKLDLETKIKISKSRKGKCQGTNNHKSRKVINLTTGEVFDTVTEASKVYGVAQCTMTEVCSGGFKKCKGCEWAYYEEVNENVS